MLSREKYFDREKYNNFIRQLLLQCFAMRLYLAIQYEGKDLF